MVNSLWHMVFQWKTHLASLNIYAGCRIAEILDAIQHKDDRRFQDLARKKMFIENTCHYQECQVDLKPFFRFEGVSIGLCVMLEKGLIYNVTPHVDKMNDPNDSVENYKHNICINKTIDDELMCGLQTSIRVAININGKKCCYDSPRRK